MNRMMKFVLVVALIFTIPLTVAWYTASQVTLMEKLHFLTTSGVGSFHYHLKFYTPGQIDADTLRTPSSENRLVVTDILYQQYTDGGGSPDVACISMFDGAAMGDSLTGLYGADKDISYGDVSRFHFAPTTRIVLSEDSALVFRAATKIDTGADTFYVDVYGYEFMPD